MIKRNAIRCKRCLQVLESKHRHHYVECGCDPPVAVDGGKYCLLRAGDPLHIEELAETSDDE